MVFTFVVYLFEAMKKQIQFVENCNCIAIFTRAVNSDIWNNKMKTY